MKNHLLLILLLTCFGFQLNAQFCLPTYNPDPTSALIHNFNLGDIVNRNSFADSATSYTFHEDLTTFLELGRTYPMTASGPTTAGVQGDWAIWIDMNNDSIFSMDERLYSDLNSRSTSGMIEIPNDPSIIGDRRMRVSYVWTSQELDPCGDYSLGESEDYTVRFVDDEIPIDYYCVPFDAFNNDEFIIDTLIIGEIVNETSGSNEYNFSDYLETEFTGDFILGDTINYMLSTDTVDNVSGGFVAWIDFNDNQIFESSEIILEDGDDLFSTQGTFIMPSDSSVLGKRKMRVRALRSNNFVADPCIFDNGTETEDYIINIITEPIIASTDNLEDNINISVFPNPSSDILNVKNENREDFDYTIYNLLGQVEQIGEIDQQNIYPINIQNFKTGIYILEIRTGHLKKQVKFLKN